MISIAVQSGTSCQHSHCSSSNRGLNVWLWKEHLALLCWGRASQSLCLINWQLFLEDNPWMLQIFRIHQQPAVWSYVTQSSTTTLRMRWSFLRHSQQPKQKELSQLSFLPWILLISASASFWDLQLIGFILVGTSCQATCCLVLYTLGQEFIWKGVLWL